MSILKDDRRGFLAKFSIAAMAMLGLPLSGRSKTKDKTADQKTNADPILEVKPMGFAWDTLDPFLFCVHHEDKFPKGNAEMGPAVSLKGCSGGQCCGGSEYRKRRLRGKNPGPARPPHWGNGDPIRSFCDEYQRRDPAGI
jgi:quercetin 2,3-dioxygenase